jgi:hypothetical protein
LCLIRVCNGYFDFQIIDIDLSPGHLAFLQWFDGKITDVLGMKI